MKLLIIKTDTYADVQYKKFLETIEDLQYDFVGFIDEDIQEPTLIKVEDIECKVYPLSYSADLDCDFILIAGNDAEILSLLPKLTDLNVPKTKLKEIFWLIQQFMTLKYENCDDKIILETLKYWKNNSINVFNQHLKDVKDSLSEVFFDESCSLPYIVFESVTGKKHKMYYPEDCPFYLIDGKQYVANITREQLPNSPHLYIKGSHKINKGDILIDAGVCEGNFALRHIDICSKVYLFESEEKWIKPLWHTFKDFEQDVIMYPNYLSDVTADNSITLDDAIPELKGEKIFLKMDIEGAEPAALRGGKNLLTNNKVKVSACSYHNTNDIVKIKAILKNYGYRTWASSGYMTYIYDPNIWDTMDFRKGVVYAENY